MNILTNMSDLPQVMQSLIDDIKVEMEGQGLNPNGNLANSLSWSLVGEGDDVHVVISAASYWDYAMRGRGPGKVPYDFKEILKQWIISKNISFSGTIDQFAGSIMYTIRQFGSSLYRWQSRRDVVSIPINKFLENIGRGIDEEKIGNYLVGQSA